MVVRACKVVVVPEPCVVRHMHRHRHRHRFRHRHRHRRFDGMTESVRTMAGFLFREVMRFEPCSI